MGQTLSYSRFPNPRFPNQQWVVLGTAAQNLKHPPDLFIPSDHRIQLAFASHLIEVPGIPVQGHVVLLGLLTLHLTSLTQLLDGSHQVFFRHPIVFQ